MLILIRKPERNYFLNIGADEVIILKLVLKGAVFGPD